MLSYLLAFASFMVAFAILLGAAMWIAKFGSRFTSLDKMVPYGSFQGFHGVK